MITKQVAQQLQTAKTKKGDNLLPRTKKTYASYISNILPRIHDDLQKQEPQTAVKVLNEELTNNGTHPQKAAYKHLLRAYNHEDVEDQLSEPENNREEQTAEDIKQKVLDKSELTRLYNGLETTYWKFIVSALFDTACRQMELRTAQHKNVKPVTKTNFPRSEVKRKRHRGIYATVDAHGKGDKYRTVFFQKNTFQLLTKLVKQGRYQKQTYSKQGNTYTIKNQRDKPLVHFYKDNGEPYAYQGDKFTRAFKQRCQNIIGHKYTPHSMRHTAITYLLDTPETNITWVSDYAGHSDIEMTETYIHVLESMKEKAIANYTDITNVTA